MAYAPGHLGGSQGSHDCPSFVAPHENSKELYGPPDSLGEVLGDKLRPSSTIHDRSLCPRVVFAYHRYRIDSKSQQHDIIRSQSHYTFR